MWGTRIGIRTHSGTGWVEVYGKFLPDRNLATDVRILHTEVQEAALRWAAEHETQLRNRPTIVAHESEPRHRETEPPLFSAADLRLTGDAALYYTTESGTLLWFVEVGDGRDGWQSGTDLRENDPGLIINARRLDADAPPLRVPRVTNGKLGTGWAMLLKLEIPTRGFWEITGNYRSEYVSIVVWVPTGPDELR